MRISLTQLCSATAGSINATGGTIREGEGKTVLDCSDSGNAPSIEEYSRSSLMLPERQFILVVQNEAMRPVIVGRPLC